MQLQHPDLYDQPMIYTWPELHRRQQSLDHWIIKIDK